MSTPSTIDGEPTTPEPPTAWQENHGNFLVAFVIVIFLVGASILAYRQLRFVPPRFPDGSAIPVVEAQPDELEGTVMIRVTGASNSQGMMMIAVYGASEAFNRKEQASQLNSVHIEEGIASWVVERDALPERLAVAAYHDEDNNGELNRNGFGIPTESYGYSRGARGLTGPPSFEEAVIELPAAGGTIEVKIN